MKLLLYGGKLIRTNVFTLWCKDVNAVMPPSHNSSYHYCMASSAFGFNCTTGILITSSQFSAVWTMPWKWLPFFICLHLLLPFSVDSYFKITTCSYANYFSSSAAIHFFLQKSILVLHACNTYIPSNLRFLPDKDAYLPLRISDNARRNCSFSEHILSHPFLRSKQQTIIACKLHPLQQAALFW